MAGMKLISCVLAVFLAVPAVTSCQSTDAMAAEMPRAATLSHDVFFTLKADSVDEADGLIESCYTLRGIPGVVHLTAGPRDTAQMRDVNEQAFHVALHVEFVDQAAYEGYGPHDLHQALLTAYGSTFDTVLVYDAHISR